MPTVRIPATERLEGWLYEAALLWITEIDNTEPDGTCDNRFLHAAERAWGDAFRDYEAERISR